MPLLYAARGAQYLLSSEFVFNFNDTLKDINGVVKTLGSTYTDAGTFDIINLPAGAQIVGGDIVVETAGVGPTAYSINLGTSGSAAIYLSAFDLKSAANTRSALLLTTLTGANSSINGLNVRMAVTSSVANATAGRWRITVLWKIDGKVNEAYPA
jgi:hypothetical protein